MNKLTALLLTFLTVGSIAAFARAEGEGTSQGTTTSSAAMSGDFVVAGTYPNGRVKYNVNPPMPASFQEAPMLAQLVAAGDLPPVEDRLPDEPFVIAPVSIGRYGGTWNRVYLAVDDDAMVDSGRLYHWDGDGFTPIPSIAKSFEFSNDGRTLTFQLREGHKWSDGQPYTTADYQWTWEALHTNKEYSPAFNSSLLSPQTKTQPRFEVIDDVTFRYTWDDPNFAVIERGLSGDAYSKGGVFVEPAHYLRQFHPDYANAAQLRAAIAEAGVDNWVQLMKLKRNGYDNVDLPLATAWKTIDGISGQEWITERNPYYHMVDSAGNQLPYLDRVHLTLVENTEIVALRAANGDIDFQARHITLDKLPLFQQNADRAGTQVTMWPATSPTDAAIYINQSYDKDPVIGDLIRNREFRRALNIAIDREDIKETFFLGMGDPRAYVPDPGTPYYPGDEWRYRDAVLDIDRANQILDDLGLTSRNSQGIRMRPDGSGPLTLHFVTHTEFGFTAIPTIISRHWKDIGINVTFNETRDAPRMIQANEEYLFVWETGGGQNPWLYPYWHFPWHVAYRAAVEAGRYYQTGGEQGEPPDSPKYRANPPLTGGEYPLKRLIDIYDEGKSYPTLDPRRIELMQEANRIHVEEMYILPTVGSTSLMKGTFIHKRNFVGVPELAANGTALHNQGPFPETYWIDG